MESLDSIARRYFKGVAEAEEAEARAERKRRAEERRELREQIRAAFWDLFDRVTDEAVLHWALIGGSLVAIPFIVLGKFKIGLVVAFAPAALLLVLMLGSLVLMLGLGILKIVLKIGLAIAGATVGLAWRAIARSRRISRQVQRGMAAYKRGDAYAVAAVHGYALGTLRDRVGAHRNRMLGPESDWERARAPLAQALDDAGGRVAYWNERLGEDPSNRMASLQLKTAKGLRKKLRSALKGVDARAEVLRQFYHRCEAKLAVMDRSNADLVEVKRLEDLAGKASAAIAHAKGTVEALAGQFLAEAQNIARALGSADRTQLRVLAGDAPLDNIEYLADKINESSERDRTAIEALEKTLAV